MTLSERDLKCIWHPYTQMYTAAPPIAIVKAKGARLWAEDGKTYLDAIASWWTNIHGHGHEHMVQAIAAQAACLDHLIFAGFTHEPAVKLAEKLLPLLPSNQVRVFYSDNGSTAVEVALKMAFQYWHNKGEKRKKVIALKGAYHGDTFGAMAVSGRSAFTQAFESFLFDVIYVEAPVTGSEEDALKEMKNAVDEYGSEIAAFIYEPMIQGTAGMRVMNPAGLQQMIQDCKTRSIFCIADEVMTGFGRTGRMFASEFMTEMPDIMCFSKGLTGGVMALGVTTCTQNVYNAFLSDDRMKTFFHGHSFTANPIACAAAVASLEIFHSEKTLQKVQQIELQHKAFAEQIKTDPKVRNIRVLGVILALEIETPASTSYFNPIAANAYNFFLEWGILMRPLGNVIYLLPPYCISEEDLQYIYEAIKDFIRLQSK
jgi:adenosylmethionine-8-amino-7-oxononanoate aminotransferase